MDHCLHPPKSLSRLYVIHPAEPKDLSGSGKYINSWPNDAAKLKSVFSRIAKPSGCASTPSAARPISQDTLQKFEKTAKDFKKLATSVIDLLVSTDALQRSRTV